MTEQQLALLKKGLAELNCNLEEKQQRQLMDYLDLLKKWNKVYNLTAIRDEEQLITHHILDSLVVLPYLWPGHWLDVGCGAGIPGLILAIAKPDWKFTLLDSNSKKTSFVQQSVVALGLKNVRVVCSRVEQEPSEKKYDGITSRAFAEIADFVSLTRHLLSVNGRWAAMKGVPEQELKKLPEDVEVEKIISLHVPGLEASRCLVILKENK